jgi:hypothetical protein
MWYHYKKIIVLLLISCFLLPSIGSALFENDVIIQPGSGGTGTGTVTYNITNIVSEMNQTPNQTPGITPMFGVDYFNGSNGAKGDKGDKGDPGTIPDSTQFPFLNGTRTLTGIWNVGGFNLSNLLDPVSAQDAATKNYVDTRGFITSTYNATYDAKPGSNYNATYDAKWGGTNYNASYWTGTNYNSSYWAGSNYNASYLTSTYNATYDAKTNYNASYLTSTYNATYDAKTNYNSSYWTGTNYNASYLISTYNATYDAKTNYNGSYWTGTNYNASYLTSTFNSTYDAKTNYNASYLEKSGTVAMTGNLSMGSKYINNLISGLLGSDAVNKSYVDAVNTSMKNYVDASGGSNYNATYDAKPTLLQVYPVGSIYISVTATNPGTIFGGTWSAFGTGRIPIGIDATNTQFDVVKETGGSNVSTDIMNHTHTATVTDRGHNHLQNINDATTGALVGYSNAEDTSTATPLATGYYTGSNTTGISVATANPSGGVTSFSIMNPYIVVYMWERTA